MSGYPEVGTADPVRGASAPATNAPPASIALWGALLGVGYLAFCWLAWDRTLIPDEIWALMNAERSWSEQIASIRADLIHPPLFYVLERIWLDLFGVSNASVKILPVIVNLAAIGLFPVLAARVTPSWRLVSFLYLATYLHVFGVPNLVRGYGLVLLLTIAAILAWDAWRRRPTSTRLAVWTAVMGLAVMTHFFGILLLASFALLGWRDAPRRSALLAASAIPAVVFCAWVGYVFPVYMNRGLSGNLKWVEPSLVQAVAIVPFHLLTMVPSGSNPVQSDWWAALPGMKFLVLGAIAVNAALVAVAFPNLRNARLDWRWLGPLTVLCFAPAIMLACISLAVGPAFHTRFLLGVIPVYWLWLAVVAERGGRPGILLLRGLVLPIVVLSIVLPLRQDLGESPLREAVARIAQDRQPGDVLAIANNVGFQSYWELRRIGLDIPFVVLPPFPVFARFTAPLEDSQRVWVLCAGGCNATVDERLARHRVVSEYGRYLRLMQLVR